MKTNQRALLFVAALVFFLLTYNQIRLTPDQLRQVHFSSKTSEVTTRFSPALHAAATQNTISKEDQRSVLVEKWYNNIRGHGRLTADDLYEEMKSRFGEAVGSDSRNSCLVLDIGANVCTFAERMLEISPCHVWAFEPVPALNGFCARMLGSHPRFKLFPVAIGSKVTTAEIQTDSDNLGWNTMVTTMAQSTMETVVVNVVPLDQLIPTGLTSVIGGIKVDVEGFEYAVMRGMRKLVQRSDWKAPPIHMEVAWGKKHPNWAEETAEFEFLFEHGYDRWNYSALEGTKDVILSERSRIAEHNSHLGAHEVDEQG